MLPGRKRPAAELAAVSANRSPDDIVTIEADEAERDQFFASLGACGIENGAAKAEQPVIAGRFDGGQSVRGEEL